MSQQQEQRSFLKDPMIALGTGNGICDTSGKRRQAVTHFRMALVEPVPGGTVGLTGVIHSFKLCSRCLSRGIQVFGTALMNSKEHRQAIFADVYSGSHPGCFNEECPCRELGRPLPDARDEAVAHVRMTERGLTIEEARASFLM